MNTSIWQSQSASRRFLDMLLIRSVKRGHFNHAKLLLQTGIDPNERDKNGRTALIETCFLANPNLRMAVLKLLLRYNAQVDLVDNQGRNLLAWACNLGLSDAVEYILEECDYNSLGVDVQDTDGNTPLLLSCKSANLGIVRKLTELLNNVGKHDSMYARDRNKISPLVQCFMRGNFEIAKHLVDEANVKIHDLTNCLLQRKEVRPDWLNKRYYSTQDFIAKITTILDKGQEKSMSNVLYLLITNENFRQVALYGKVKAQLDGSTETPVLKHRSTKPIIRHSQPRLRQKNRTSPDTHQLRSARSAVQLKNSSDKGSIKNMLPSLMKLYGEQTRTSYRSTSKMGFVRTDTPGTDAGKTRRVIKREKSSLSDLPIAGQLNRMESRLNVRFMKSSRSHSVQLPRVSPLVLLNGKHRDRMLQEV